MNLKKTVEQMKLKDKINLCTGKDFWRTREMKKYGIKSIMMADGPHGLRCQPGKADMVGVNNSVKATCFPTAVTSGATWNPELLKKEGAAIGIEALKNGVSIVLGPGCNIKRNPLGGRNFEYFSEDPYLSGKMAAAYIKGQQATGVMSCIKHFAVNNQEYKRQNGNSILDERTLREIYLKPFEIAVKEAQPKTLMCAYNKVNGEHCSDSKKLLTDILRNEWGFDGLVITDWGGLNDRIEGFRAGCDLNMPGGSNFMTNATAKAVKKGGLDEACIDNSVLRLLKILEDSKTDTTLSFDEQAHSNLALEIAQQGAVLLKNQDNILPAKCEDITLFGALCEHVRYQGAGSSHINPFEVTKVTEAMSSVPFYPCSDEFGNVTEDGLKLAEEKASLCKTAVVVVGLPENYESEAFDRAHISLPEGYNKLVKTVAKANPNTVVVLMGGSAMELPWLDEVKSVLYMGLAGQVAGAAVANIITGKVNPSGKLTETWPLSYDDVPSKETFGKKNTEYREGIFVGYRYYDSADKAVAFPFGHGLSYSNYEYSDIEIKENKLTFTLKNTGEKEGAEVAQIYVTPPEKGIFRAKKELRAFKKVYLKAGESRKLEFEIEDSWFEVWADNSFKKLGGDYKIQAGSSVRDIRLARNISVEGDEGCLPQSKNSGWYKTLSGLPDRESWQTLMGKSVPEAKENKKGSFTLDNTCAEMKDSSLLVKLIYHCAKIYIGLNTKGKKDDTNTSYKMLVACATDCPVRALVINGGGWVKDWMAKVILKCANGFIKRN